MQGQGRSFQEEFQGWVKYGCQVKHMLRVGVEGSGIGHSQHWCCRSMPALRGQLQGAAAAPVSMPSAASSTVYYHRQPSSLCASWCVCWEL